MPLVTWENFGEMLIEAAREMVAVHRGEKEPARVEYRVMTRRQTEVASPPRYTGRAIRQIRKRMGVSQSVFAQMLNCSVSTVKAWEQTLREPDGPTLRLLEIADRSPEVLLAAVSGAGPAGEEQPAATRKKKDLTRRTAA